MNSFRFSLPLRRARGACLASGAALSLALAASAQQATATAGQDPSTASQDQRLDRVEAENAELRRRIDLVAEDLEGLRLTDIIQPLGTGAKGMGPAASKVYGIDHGLSIGGYGEVFARHDDSGTDTADALRGVLYFGYRFDEHWVLNTEIEIEHANEAFLEFAYLDYLSTPGFNVRAGLLLAPMGFLNEMHEPTTFFGVARPGIETVIMPSTFRENGAGIHGELGDFVYRAYVLNGFDAAGFTDAGLRGGRQKGSTVLAEDWAVTGRLDWMGLPGTTLGASTWVGDSGQGQVAGGDVGTTILEGHAEWRWRGLRTRFLYTQAELDDVAALNADLGLTGSDSIGEELNGWYAEAAYDVMGWLKPTTKQQLSPFVRWETYDTQAEVPAGFVDDPANDVEILTVGLDWKPIPSVVFKTDVMEIEDAAGGDSTRFNIGLGYVF
jgi:hypothetical protein